jgi:uncharacterized protein (TIGR03382 family)
VHALILALLSPPATAAVTVDGVAYPTLDDALAAAGPGDVLTLDPGDYVQPVDLTGRTVTLAGDPADPGAVRLLWDGATTDDAVVRTDSDTTLRDLTVTSGVHRAIRQLSGSLVLERVTLSSTLSAAAADPDGGCLLSSGPLTVTDSLFAGCTSPFEGGAIWAGGSSAVILRTRFVDNVAADDGGAIYASNTLTTWMLDQSTFCGNVATLDGGAVLTRSALTARNNTFAGNVAGPGDLQQGGAVFVINTTATLEQNAFLENDASSGAATFSQSAPVPVTFRDNIVADNLNGAAVAFLGAPVSVTYNAFDGNLADALVAVPATNLLATPPALLGWTPGVCPAQLALDPGSPLIDAGDPAQFDPDGTRADIGPTGGAGAPGFVDADGDGALAAYECDDADDTTFVGAGERCDGIDNDCDTVVDETPVDAPPWFFDQDGDGYGDLGAPTPASCDAPVGAVADATDCDDGEATTYPGATEYCDNTDSDCDGDNLLNAVDPGTYWWDDDGDGLGGDQAVVSCSIPDGAQWDTGDCDDTEPGVRPGFDEVCGDGLDNDCANGADGPDAVDAALWFADADADGFGDPVGSVLACAPPAGFVADATDCDPAAGDVAPGLAELCDDRDNDCDGAADEDLPIVALYADADGDGRGDPNVPVDGCRTDAAGYAPAPDDCDDTESAAWTGNAEVCDGVDNDCDGGVDVGAVDAPTWYLDTDGDGYGDPAQPVVDCLPPSGTVANADDCDDTRPEVHAPEDCAGADTAPPTDTGAPATDTGTPPLPDPDGRATDTGTAPKAGGCSTSGATASAAGIALAAAALRRRRGARGPGGYGGAAGR